MHRLHPPHCGVDAAHQWRTPSSPSSPPSSPSITASINSWVSRSCSINRASSRRSKPTTTTTHKHDQRRSREVLTAAEMEVQPELSLGPASLGVFAAMKSPRSSSSDSDGSGGGKKRKHLAWEAAVSHASGLELQLGDPLPLDWEQCLDLHSGRMYYLNRKTMKKSWVRPRSNKEEQAGTLNLELNISMNPSTFTRKAVADESKSMDGGGHMVAVPCVNCHLLVMLCKSSPACPNCKFVQPSVAVPAMPRTPPRRLDAVKPLETLSLLH